MPLTFSITNGIAAGFVVFTIIKLAKKENLIVKDGEDMLLYQGVLALELFIGKSIDKKTVEVMRKALKEK